ncbi:MAG: hypothetical protein WCG61_04730 [Chlorobium sp.]
MPLLSEYAITPGIFEKASFASESFAEIRFEHLQELLFDDGLVRNLYGGYWLELFNEQRNDLHSCGKNFLKALRTRKRFVDFVPVGERQPISDADWCKESLFSHHESRLNGIVTSQQTARVYGNGQPLITSVDKLTNSEWWKERRETRGSMPVERTTVSYLEQMKPFLAGANSLMFIDANLDPKKGSYREFYKMLEPLENRREMPLIEIHRTIYERNPARQNISIDEWRKRFCDCDSDFTKVIKRLGLEAKVFLWDKMHDRYLITNLMGVSVPNGFDIGGLPTIWSTISRKSSDVLQREFDPNGRQHKMEGSFRIE